MTSSQATTLGVFGVGPRCRPWTPKRHFGGTPLWTEWFSHIPTNFGLPSVRWPLCSRVVDTEIGVKRSRWYRVRQ